LIFSWKFPCRPKPSGRLARLGSPHPPSSPGPKPSHRPIWPTGLRSLSPQPRPICLSASFGRRPTHCLPAEHLCRLLAFLSQHPSPPVAKMNRRRYPFHLPDTPLPLPIFSHTRNGCAIEAPPSRRWLFSPPPTPLHPRPYKRHLDLPRVSPRSLPTPTSPFHF
jgi:hypothetical protein